ncbi:unnamed protein product [Linum trigynum]|uniref:Uncharacterized protein n=1 Tax=Linum trigynum TaxID=586398 RepID=A0AAV2F2H8_9ROSI
MATAILSPRDCLQGRFRREAFALRSSPRVARDDAVANPNPNPNPNPRGTGGRGVPWGARGIRRRRDRNSHWLGVFHLAATSSLPVPAFLGKGGIGDATTDLRRLLGLNLI